MVWRDAHKMADLGDAFPGIDSRPDVCEGEACIVRTRIPVWLLVLAAYPSLRAEDLVNAWNYARAHAAEMEMQIHANEAA